MKKLIPYLFMTTLLGLWSCNAQDAIPYAAPDDGTLYDVVLNIENFTSESSHLRSTKATLGGEINHLAYWVYRDNGTVLMLQKKISGNEVKEQLKIQVPTGTYKLLMFASNKPIETNFYGDKISQDFIWNNTSMYTDVNTDIFSGMIDFAVDQQGTAKSITLNRRVGRVQLKLNDLHLMPTAAMTILPVVYETITIGSDTYFSLRGYQHIKGDNKTVGFTYFSTSTPYEPLFQEVSSFYNSLSMSRESAFQHNVENPINFMLPENVNYIDASSNLNRNIDLYLVGIKNSSFNSLTSIAPVIDHNVGPSSLMLNPNIVFAKLLKKGLTLSGGQSVRISGSIFNENHGLNISIDESWGNTIDEEF